VQRVVQTGRHILLVGAAVRAQPLARDARVHSAQGKEGEEGAWRSPTRQGLHALFLLRFRLRYAHSGTDRARR